MPCCKNSINRGEQWVFDNKSACMRDVCVHMTVTPWINNQVTLITTWSPEPAWTNGTFCPVVCGDQGEASGCAEVPMRTCVLLHLHTFNISEHIWCEASPDVWTDRWTHWSDPWDQLESVCERSFTPPIQNHVTSTSWIQNWIIVLTTTVSQFWDMICFLCRSTQQTPRGKWTDLNEKVHQAYFGAKANHWTEEQGDLYPRASHCMCVCMRACVSM